MTADRLADLLSTALIEADPVMDTRSFGACDGPEYLARIIRAAVADDPSIVGMEPVPYHESHCESIRCDCYRNLYRRAHPMTAERCPGSGHHNHKETT